MVELLKQGHDAPLPVAEQVCLIYAGVATSTKSTPTMSLNSKLSC